MTTNALRRLLQPLTDWANRNPDKFEQIYWWVEYATATSDGGEDDVSGLRRVAARAQPPNWLDLPIAQLPRVPALMHSTGLCVAWVPRAEVVSGLLAAEDKEERDAVLLTCQEEILDDLDSSIHNTGQPQLRGLREGAQSAVAAYRGGHGRAAQALCVPLVTELLEVHLDAPSFKEAKKALLVEDAAAVDMRGARAAVVQAALHTAIRHSAERGPGAGFNRHSSAHGLDPVQYTPAHALAGMMLTVGSLREVNEAYREFEADLPHYSTVISDAVRRRAADPD